MDTRFWGPSGWKLLHLIAAEPMKTERHRKAVAAWFALLPFVLPCKFCRASLTDYYKAQPLTHDILTDPTKFSRWIYDIHNRVNEKLREQGLLTASNPSWEEIQKLYRTEHAGLCRGSPLLGWDFMTSVAFNTPESDYFPTPMSDTPENLSATADAKTRNRYNLLTRAERLRWLQAWWILTPAILPCAAWRSAWVQAMRMAGSPPLKRGRDAMVRWMWAIEAHVCADLRCPTPHTSLTELEKTVGAFESGCGSAKKGTTCRTRKKGRRDRVRTQRRRKGQDIL
jgi:hypothetical protein